MYNSIWNKISKSEIYFEFQLILLFLCLDLDSILIWMFDFKFDLVFLLPSPFPSLLLILTHILIPHFLISSLAPCFPTHLLSCMCSLPYHSPYFLPHISPLLSSFSPSPLSQTYHLRRWDAFSSPKSIRDTQERESFTMA